VGPPANPSGRGILNYLTSHLSSLHGCGVRGLASLLVGLVLLCQRSRNELKPIGSFRHCRALLVIADTLLLRGFRNVEMVDIKDGQFYTFQVMSFWLLCRETCFLSSENGITVQENLICRTAKLMETSQPISCPLPDRTACPFDSREDFS
jgi:hypothetical protein